MDGVQFYISENAWTYNGLSQKPIAIINVEKVTKFWYELSEYCHRQLSLENTWHNENWVKDGYTKLNEVEDYIWEIMVKSSTGWLHQNSLPIRVKEIAEDFIDGKIDNRSLENRLKLVLPVLMEKEKKSLTIHTLKK